MKRFLKYGVLAALIAAPLLSAQQVTGVHRVTLAADFDLDGAAASTSAIHSADQIVDSTNYTIDAQPDSPRLLVVTVVDADSSISACTYTVTGTLADGTRVTATTSLSGGSGSKVLSPVLAFKTVITAGNAVCTGEGGAADTVALGTSGNAAGVYVAAWGRSTPSSQGYNILEPFVWKSEEKTIKTSGSSTSITSGVASSGAFRFVGVGDILTFSIKGEVIERAVATKSDNDNITVNDAVNIVTPVPYRFRTAFAGPGTTDGWFGVDGLQGGTFIFNVEQIGQSVDVRVECKAQGTSAPVVVILDSAQATAPVVVVQAIDFTLAGYDLCRAGVEFTTPPDGGDGGGALEIITVQFLAVR